jgi:hydroxybutyrate-dimer hydrolase
MARHRGLVVLAALGVLGWTGPCRAAEPPSWLRPGPRLVLDGASNDLVTAGLGAEAMLKAPPAYADPAKPTAAELRRAALFVRASAGQGYGRLYGPGVDHRTGAALPDGGRIAGEEVLAFADDGAGRRNVAMLLQIPAGLSRERRCLLAVPVSGSSSLYRDVVDFGYWGLRRGCAVVYTDKGHGNGFHLLEPDTVNLLDGRQVPAAEAGAAAHFRVDLDDAARRAFLKDWPNRVAFKAAHSKRNPETTWGEDVLDAVRFAFYEVGRRDPGFVRANTVVIGSGSSNGGGAVLYAGEKDAASGAGLLDGIVAREPQVQLRPDDRVVVGRAGRERRGTGRTLMDYFTFGNLYQPCALLAVPDAPLRDRIEFAANRCTSLREKGLLTADGTEAQAREALERMRGYGWDPETEIGHAFGYFVAPDATATKYANDHGRFDVSDRLCGYSYGAVDKEGRPMPVPATEAAQNFALAPGGAPAASIDVINDDDPTGPRRSWLSASRSTGRQDYNLDGALCLRDLVTGASERARRVQAGIAEFVGSGRLGGKPTIIVHGRSDDRVPAAFSGRPYAALNSLQDGERARLSYVEVTNAEHFDTDLPGFDTRMVPLKLYHLRALDLMWAHLVEGTPLPPSQVVRTTPRGGEPGKAPPLQPGQLPPISAKPGSSDLIEVSAGRMAMPD